MPTYSLFIERPRTGADPVPYGPFLKTKSLPDAEAWVAAPVLTAKAAANVREGDLFTARYPDPKLRDERGPISRIVAFGKVTTAGIDVYTAQGASGGVDGIGIAGSWLRSASGARLLNLAVNVPRQVLVAAACAIAKAALKRAGKEKPTRVDVVIAWTHGKDDIEPLTHRGSSWDAYFASVLEATIQDPLLASGIANSASNAGVITLYESADIVRKRITLPEVLVGHP